MRIRGVHTVVSKGRTYHYAWRGGPRLKAKPDTEEFLQEVAAARAGRVQGDKSKLSGLIAAYKASAAYKGLSDKTRKEWVRWLDRIQEKFGALPLRAFDQPKAVPAIRRWRDGYASAPRSADVALEAFSRLLTYGRAEGLLSGEPCKHIPRLYKANRAAKIWEPEHFAELERRASPEVYRAARLAALTGLRRGDLLRLSWSHVRPLAIEISTGKSRHRKTTLIPIYAELRELLDSIPKRATTVLTTEAGTPWGTGFGASWNKAVRAEPSTPDKLARERIPLHFHDLRGTAATMFYRAGFSIREIAEIMTWGEEQVERLVNAYVKRDEILLDRIRRMDLERGRNGKV